jgi:hypothetical protein
VDKHPLDSFLNKLNRAEVHLNAIKETRRELGQIDFYDLRTELDYKGRPVARFRNVRRPKLLDVDLPLLIGDCVYNYRSALDHLAYALAAAYTNPLPERLAKTSAFPIFWKSKDYRRKGTAGAASKMEGMSRRARGAIQRVQPYHRRKYPPLRFLWMLEELNRVDKHRFIHLTGAVAAEGAGEVTGANVQRLHIRHIVRPIKEGARFQVIESALPSPREVQVKADITPDVIFDDRTDAQSVRNHYVIETLVAIREVILRFVLVSLSPEIAGHFGSAIHVTQTPAPLSSDHA